LLSFRGFSHYYLPENGQNTLVFLVQDTYYIGVEN
jgi:hypothetical protein